MKLVLMILSNTKYTVIVCALVLFLALFVRGSFFDYFKMKAYQIKIAQEIKAIQVLSKDFKKKLEKVNDPHFIEKQIKERFDFVKEGDLVFIFSSQSEGSL